MLKEFEAKFTKYILTKNNHKIILLKKLKKKKIDFNKAKSSNFFDHTTLANEKIDLITQEDGFIIFAAPGEDMLVDKQNAPTDIEVQILRNKKKENKLESFLPEPLANSSEEFLIKDSSAIAYEIKQGDYIRLTATYNNTTDDIVEFGLLSVNEMMILFGYFYYD